jgi:uncharacterized protein YigA (DUF484 family)
MKQFKQESKGYGHADNVSLQNIKMDILRSKYEKKLQLTLADLQKKPFKDEAEFERQLAEEATMYTTYDQFNFGQDTLP